MSEPGTKCPPSRFPKDTDGDADTRLPMARGSKLVKKESLQFGQPSDIGTAPPSRVYTRDYSKVGRDRDQSDLVGPALGNPLGL